MSGAARSSAEIADAPAFDLAFFPARRRVAGSGEKATLAGEGQEARIEADQSANVLGDDSQKIVVPTFASDAAQGLKGMQVATDESLEALAMGELDVEHPAVSLDQTESVELALVAGIVQAPKWPQSTSKRSAGPGSMRTKARGGCRGPRSSLT